MRVNRPKITLSPWEVAPNVEIRPTAIGSFFDLRMSKNGPSRPVGAIKHPITADGYYAVFLRFLDAEDEGNWVILDSASCLKYAGDKSELKLPWRLKHDEVGTYPHLGRVFNASSLGLAKDNGFIITVGSRNSASYMNIRQILTNVPFKLNSHEIRPIFDTPFVIVKEAIQREMSQPDSDAGFAFKWMALEDPHRFAYRTQRGQWDEFMGLLQAVGILFPNPKNNVFNLFRLRELNIEEMYHGYSSAIMRRRYLWNLELIRNFQPFVAPELRRFTCVRDWLSGMGEICYIPRPHISAHDQLEAANLLFNWAQDKMSSRKLKLLLPY